MSNVYVEKIDSSNYTVSTLFTSSSFTSLPTYIPLNAPPPVRKYRVSFAGDSTSFLSVLNIYWDLVQSTIQINNYSGPSLTRNDGISYFGSTSTGVNQTKGGNVGNFFGNTINKGIYISDGNGANGRIVRISNMIGGNWTTFGTFGSGTNQFEEPVGIAIDSKNKIYIGEALVPTISRIVRVDDMLGTNWTTFGSVGTGTNQFEGVTGVALDSSSRIYAVDNGNNRIVRIDDMTGTNWTTFGSLGTGVNQFNGPWGIFIDSNNKIYIADQANTRIVRIDDMTGTNWTTFGTSGVGTNQFKAPTGIYVASNGQIYVADQGSGQLANRIVRIDDMTGTNWTTFGAFGTGTNQFQGPTSVYLDSSNTIYVCDFLNNRIVSFTDMIGTNWTTFGTVGTGTNQFQNPWFCLPNL